MEVVTPVKSQCKIARNDEGSSLYHNSSLINFTDQPLSVPCFQSGISFAHFGINFAVLHTYVSVNSNWVHPPPGATPGKFF